MSLLPPDMDEAGFAAFLEELRGTVGADWVWSGEADMFPYRDSFSPVWNTGEERHASAAVAPENVEQVSEVVRIARRHRVPLFPISTGKNFGYGGPSPNVNGSVVLDLKRMNRVIEVNEERAYCLVEPGVSYFDLYREIQERGLKLMLDCPDPGWGSPVGNSLERGVGYTMPHFRDHFGAHCGMEVVLPDGEVMRTGMGALPGSDTWQEYPYGFGPDPAGLFAQGNFGVVTKMGFRLLPLPEYYRSALITVPRRRDFVKLVNHVNYLSDSGLIGEVEYGSPLSALMGNADFMALATRTGGPSDAEMDAAASDAGLHNWQVELQFFGPEKATLENWHYAKDRILSDIPGAASFEGDHFPMPATEEQLNNTTQPWQTSIKRRRSLGVPSLGAWKIVRDDGHVGFFPVLPRTGEAVFEVQRVLGDAMKEFPTLPPFFNALTTPLFWHTHTFQMVFAPSIKHDDPAHNAITHAAMKKCVAVAAEHGWGDYRAAPIYQDDVAGTYSFNNHILRRFHEQLKDAIDPDGIIAPGRGGIWPRRFRA
ncbi:FAD-binding oxidoreductase [Alteraurantiacibacter aquimixticola]|uniref:FAD-binding oxidoreductase n=1 Tax=Alteraurantiacibacter aquimixticola TaxID=2489173 RepID=A0A4T3F1J7_9SPHN|nr:FAD-binding oxidoreductase [Alteraurantiacibacter aquimixticola]TIX50948.1 FAD-binding oxidoreductase [Alteraurantiacibacter aquimixticola]